MDTFGNCSCTGKNLSKLVQPALMNLLANGPQHGYSLIQGLENMIMFKGETPDPSGVYRLLKDMENNKLVESSWELKETGPAKRIFSLTRLGWSCLRQWLETLEEYRLGLDELIRLAGEKIQQNIHIVELGVKVTDHT